VLQDWFTQLHTNYRPLLLDNFLQVCAMPASLAQTTADAANLNQQFTIYKNLSHVPKKPSFYAATATQFIAFQPALSHYC
jgi:hypothetical protein